MGAVPCAPLLAAARAGRSPGPRCEQQRGGGGGCDGPQCCGAEEGAAGGRAEPRSGAAGMDKSCFYGNLSITSFLPDVGARDVPRQPGAAPPRGKNPSGARELRERRAERWSCPGRTEAPGPASHRPFPQAQRCLSPSAGRTSTAPPAQRRRSSWSSDSSVVLPGAPVLHHQSLISVSTVQTNSPLHLFHPAPDLIRFSSFPLVLGRSLLKTVEN